MRSEKKRVCILLSGKCIANTREFAKELEQKSDRFANRNASTAELVEFFKTQNGFIPISQQSDCFSCTASFGIN